MHQHAGHLFFFLNYSYLFYPHIVDAVSTHAQVGLLIDKGHQLYV